jgi:hypothetical protein
MLADRKALPIQDRMVRAGRDGCIFMNLENQHTKKLSLNYHAERLSWVDTAKGLGIFLVVFGHVWRGLENAGLIEIQNYF